MSKRVGVRGGPRGRNLLVDQWDGTRETIEWSGPTSVRVHPVGESFSVIRHWSNKQANFVGWYVNFEKPWARNAVGYDSRDNVLDVVMSDDLADCQLKDEDELDFAVATGSMSVSEAHRIRLDAVDVASQASARRGPFEDALWSRLALSLDATPPRMPVGWLELGRAETP